MTEDPGVYAEIQENEEKKKRKSEGKGKRGRPKKSRPVNDLHDSSEDEQGMQPVQLDDSSEYSDEAPERDEVLPASDFINKEPEVDDFVLVELKASEGRFAGNRPLHYVGQVQELLANSRLRVHYLRLTSRCGSWANFHFPERVDESEVDWELVKGVLGKPHTGATKRLRGLFRFPQLASYNLV